ncbi:MAG: response regulator [Elusimicrobiota bacterium]
MKILVVDDEIANVSMVHRYLEREGYTVVTACDGQEALVQIRRQAPDLILLDIAMPVLDGLTLCARLRSNYRTRGLPVIFMTARGSLADRLEGFRIGADDFVTKPFDLEELKVRIEATLQRRQWDLWRNPLTLLPGSLGIRENVQQRMQGSNRFAFAYLDIDYFKAFNDVYGYDAGDRMIQLVAKLVMDAAEQTEQAGSFPGHIGGDDFVLISTIDTLQQILPVITAQFDARCLDFYRPEDRRNRQIRTKNRRGEEQTFPLVSLSVAVVAALPSAVSHYAQLVEVASEMKQFIKKQDHQGRSLVMWDRRNSFGVPPVQMVTRQADDVHG